jgi:heptose III glucuronosyltransferase
MSSTPQLSIITPAYNAAIWLPSLAEAVAAAAKHCALEWIVINDGSTDDTADVLARISLTIPVTVLSQSNVGLSETRNRGIPCAHGKYIWFVDADDLIIPSALPSLLAAMQDAPDMIGLQALRFGESPNETLIYQVAKPNQLIKGEDWLRMLLKQHEWRHYAWIYLYRRDYLFATKLQFARNTLHEDIAFNTEAVLRAVGIRYISQPAYRYRCNPNSLTGSRDDKRLTERINSYFHVVADLRAINQGCPMQKNTRRLLGGEVIGQALQVFELTKQLQSETTRKEILQTCRERRFAQSLVTEIANYKRFRQVLTMWLKQLGWLSVAPSRVG